MSRQYWLFALALAVGCKANNQPPEDQTKVYFTPQFTPGPPTLVYKTKGDYRRLVPVTLSEDRSRVVAYPHPRDLVAPSGGLALPTELREGYLLDNRGVGPQSAFLNLTYEEYAALSEVPALDELRAAVIDADPFVSLCHCGQRRAFDDPIGQINEVIEAGKLEEVCQVVVPAAEE